jgi:WD40-like Beta Propeller Repeat
MTSILLALLLTQSDAAKPAADAVKVSPPTVVAELDTGKLRGEPIRLAWSPDGTEFYVQAAERDGAGAVKSAKHYVVPVGGGAPKEVEQEPAWAAKYWTWKSWKNAPGSPAFAISVDERREVLRATQAVRGSSEAGMGGDSSAGTAVGGGGPAGGGTMAVGEGQNASIRTMRLKGEVIGEWVNTVIVPGLTFGWSPAALNLIAFSSKNEDLVIMDEQGRKQKIDTSKVTRLPAWSDDGKKLAFLEQKDRKKYVLSIVDVMPGT